MSLIVDASVAVKWLTDEDDSAIAEAVYLQGADLLGPDLLLAEVGNALVKKYRHGLVSQQAALQAIDAVPRYFRRLVSTVELAERATALAIELGHPIYDCFYLALAERERAPLVSADRKLLAAAGRLGTIEARALA